MREFRTIVDIDAPIDRAWSVLADLERWPESTPSVSSVELLDAGALGIGRRVRVCQPRLRPAIWTITEWTPPHRFVWVARSPGLRTTAGHHLDRRGEGCVLQLTLFFTGPLSPVAILLGGKLTREYMGLEANGLKARSEAGKTPGL